MKGSADIVPVRFCKHGPVEVPVIVLVRETPQPVKPMDLQSLRTTSQGSWEYGCLQ